MNGLGVLPGQNPGFSSTPKDTGVAVQYDPLLDLPKRGPKTLGNNLSNDKVITYAPYRDGVNRKQPTVVYETEPVSSPVMKVDMSKYQTPISSSNVKTITMNDYYNDISRSHPTSLNFGFKMPRFKRRRRRIYIT